MLKRFNRSKYPPNLVSMVDSHKSVIRLIDDEDWGDAYYEDWKEKYNSLLNEEKKIVDELLFLPEYEEVEEHLYDLVKEIAIKLRKSRFSHKQIQEYIERKFEVILTFGDKQWLRGIFQIVDADGIGYRNIISLTDSEIQDICKEIGIPRGTGSEKV